MENKRKYRDIKLITIERERNYLVPGPNYHTTMFFYKKFISNMNEKTQIFMNRPAYLRLSILGRN